MADTSTQSMGEKLAAIGRSLDETTAAWVAAGYPMTGPEYECREEVFVALRAWNAEMGA